MSAEPATNAAAPAVEHSSPGHAPKIHGPGDMARVAIGALGVVYGDIGTSPLYTIKECFGGEHHVAPTTANVLGILSLVFWALTLVIVVKYLSFIMRADNRGEGGTLSLLALVSPPDDVAARKRRATLILLGLFGASLLYGEGMITPAISVLSAVEGLGVATHALDKFVVPITVVIIVGIFLVQKHGTAKVGSIFGPATLVWFIAIAVAGARMIFQAPEVLGAVNPLHGLRFFLDHGLHGFLVLGSVVLCITGGEALYADMGHFGKGPIRVAWYAVVFPALLLNYFGQGALLLTRGADPTVLQSPFYGLVSGTWALYPMVAIATVATVVASQALISGAYSITQQAVQLGYFPRVTIKHTSGEAEGQIYIPEINGILMVACVALVLAFRSSSSLAAAYGIAVTGTMTITSLLFYAVARTRWGWPVAKAGALTAMFLAVDVSFFLANVVKFTHGGWFPVAVALVMFSVLTTWKRGRASLARFMLAATTPMEAFMSSLEVEQPTRVRGTAVFMTSNPEGVPPVLMHHFKHNKVLHEKVILLSIATRHVPEVPPDERVEITALSHGFYKVNAHYGFMQTPNALEVLAECATRGLKSDVGDTSFYLGRETLLTTGRSGMSGWRKALFAYLSRNARPATAFFRIPPNRVVEMGTQIEL